MEKRLEQGTMEVKNQLGQAIGDLGSRVERTERRLDGIVDEVNCMVDRRLAKSLGKHGMGDSYPAGGSGVPEIGGCSGAVMAGGLKEPVVPIGDEGGRSYASAVVGPGGRAVVTSLLPRRSGKSKEEDYWCCRKALRLHPVGQGDDCESVKAFLTTHLLLDSDFMSNLGPFTVKRIPSGPGSKVRDEAVVTFDTIDARDAVKRSAKNLAGKGRGYGVRLELPNYLKTAMSALQHVSYEIKQKFPEARRNVLFDDETMDLVLDFSTGEGRPWRRMSSQQARDRKKRKPSTQGGRLTMEAEEIDNILDHPTSDREEAVP